MRCPYSSHLYYFYCLQFEQWKTVTKRTTSHLGYKFHQLWYVSSTEHWSLLLFWGLISRRTFAAFVPGSLGEVLCLDNHVFQFWISVGRLHIFGESVPSLNSVDIIHKLFPSLTTWKEQDWMLISTKSNWLLKTSHIPSSTITYKSIPNWKNFVGWNVKTLNNATRWDSRKMALVSLTLSFVYWFSRIYFPFAERFRA